jgi:hypothetical protein
LRHSRRRSAAGYLAQIEQTRAIGIVKSHALLEQGREAAALFSLAAGEYEE